MGGSHLQRYTSNLLSDLLLDDDPFFNTQLSAFLTSHPLMNDQPSSALTNINNHTAIAQFRTRASYSRSRRTPTPSIKIEEVRVEEIVSQPAKTITPTTVELPDDGATGQIELANGSGLQWMVPELLKKNSNGSISKSCLRYDGPQGAYYMATRTKRGGPEGVVEEEFEEEDSATCKHTKRLSRGDKNKVHSITAKQDIRTGEVKRKEIVKNLIGKEPIKNLIEKEPVKKLIGKEPVQNPIEKEPVQNLIGKETTQNVIEEEFEDLMSNWEKQTKKSAIGWKKRNGFVAPKSVSRATRQPTKALPFS